MQDGFIDFVDIKLQSAEETRLNVKIYINGMYKRFITSDNLSELSIRSDFIRDAIYDFCNVGLLNDNVKNELIRRIDKEYWSRRDELIEREEKE